MMYRLAQQRRLRGDPAPAPAARRQSCADVISRRVEGDLHHACRADLTARARRLAQALAGAGLAPGDGVATLAWNGHRHVELALAACVAGRRLVPLDPTDHPDSIVRAARDAQVRIVFFDLSFMPLVEEIARRLSAVHAFVALTDPANMPGPTLRLDLRCYEELLEGASPWSETLACPPWTDIVPGATTHDQSGFTFQPQDTALSAIPLSQPEGRMLARAAWQAGAGLVLPGPWLDGRSLHALITGEGASVVAAPGPVWRGLLAHVEREGASLAGLHLAILSGDAMSQGPVASALRERHGLEVLGLSPTSPLYRWGDGGGAARLGSNTTDDVNFAKEETP